MSAPKNCKDKDLKEAKRIMATMLNTPLKPHKGLEGERQARKGKGLSRD